jgi:hypothetical protein
MDREQIMQWAREAGIPVGITGGNPSSEELEAFAKLVRDDYSNKHAQLWLKRIDEAVIAEREACVEVVDYMAGRCKHPDEIADAIRARENK